MKSTEYLKILTESGGYTTDPAAKTRGMDKLLGRFDWWFYVRLFTILGKACHTASKEGRYTDDTWMMNAQDMLSAAEGCGARVIIDGYENFTACGEPKVTVANHMSLIDTMLLPSMTLNGRHSSIVIKRSLWDNRLFGYVMKAVEAIPVDRKNPRDDLKTVLTKGTASLNAGHNVVLYPQSTRAASFNPGLFNSLGVKLAARAGVKVIPVALKTDFQGVGQKYRDIGPLDRSQVMRFRFGPAMDVTGNGRDAQAACLSFVTDTLREWGVSIVGE